MKIERIQNRLWKGLNEGAPVGREKNCVGVQKMEPANGILDHTDLPRYVLNSDADPRLRRVWTRLILLLMFRRSRNASYVHIRRLHRDEEDIDVERWKISCGVDGCNFFCEGCPCGLICEGARWVVDVPEGHCGGLGSGIEGEGMG